MLNDELSTSGHCKNGAVQKTYKDSLKETISTCHIDRSKWDDLTTHWGDIKVSLPLRRDTGIADG